MLTSHYPLTCDGFPTHVPITVCENLTPLHFAPNLILGQPINMSPYRIHVSNTSYTPGALMTVTVNGTEGFKGFLVQARAAGDPRPVGNFQGNLPSNQTYIWCSGGDPQNTITHRRTGPALYSWKELHLTWKAPDVAVGNISFWAIILHNYTIYWSGIQSAMVSGPPAVAKPPPTLEPGFKITKQECGIQKSCYSEPEHCTNSSDCEILVTYKTDGENITFEMSGKHRYIAVGFNDKQEMNQTDTITCSTSSSSAVEIRHYFLDFHQPIRSDLTNSADITRHIAAYENGTITCRFSRKITPFASNMRDLTKNWFFIFAWSGVSTSGGLNYHLANASYSGQRVNVTRPSTLKNGRKAPPAPPPDGKLEFSKADCGKTKNCYSEPTACSSSANCDYLVTFTPCQNKNDVDFELSAKSDWVAIGFNTKSKMDGTDTIICSRLDSGVAIKHYTLVNYNNPIQTNPAPAGVKVISGAYENGVIKCRFSRDKTASGILRLDQKIFLIFARGSVSQGGILNKHSEKSQSASQIDVCELSATLESKSSDLTLLRAHGAIMLVAWIVFATMAILVARYLKDAWGDICGKKGWFQIHRALTVTCLLLNTTGFVLVFVHAEGWSDSGGVHSVLGVIITFLACVQPILALFRPAPDAERRYIFNWTHRIVGISAFILAVANIILGLKLPHLDAEFAVYFVIAFCVGMATVVVLEIVRTCSQGKHSLLTQITIAFIGVLVVTVSINALIFIVREVP